MPSWRCTFNVLVLLSLVGFGLTVVSTYWHILILLIIVAAVAWLLGLIRRFRS
jgi:hypothetical protein